FHFRLDERVAGFPHQWSAAQGSDPVEQHLAALNISDDSRSRTSRQNVACQVKQHLVAPEDAASRVDDAQPVAVAVEGDAEIAALTQDGCLQLLQVLRHCGIGMVTRKVAVYT